MHPLTPLYTHASDSVTYEARARLLGPGDIAIVTSSQSGPSPFDAALVGRIRDLESHGVTVLGYVHASYGARTVDELLDDIVAWHRDYAVPRVFVDEWSADWGARYLGAVWGAIRGYVKSTPANPVILAVNPGVPLPLVNPPGTGTVVVVHENTEPPFGMTPQPWEAAIVHSTPPGQVADVWRHLELQGFQYGYVTSDGLTDSNPFDEEGDN